LQVGGNEVAISWQMEIPNKFLHLPFFVGTSYGDIGVYYVEPVYDAVAHMK